jgi:hypothetical protein
VRDKGKVRKREHTRTKTINFKCVDLAISRIVHDPVLGDGGPDTGGEVVHVVCEVPLPAYGGHDVRCGVEVPGEHHVCRDEELVDRAFLPSVHILLLIHHRI